MDGFISLALSIFAGGTVVHISSGVSALAALVVIGRRQGYPREPMLPNNLTLTVTGAGLLWVGWFGFNAGSALRSKRSCRFCIRGDQFRSGRSESLVGSGRMVLGGQANHAGRRQRCCGRPSRHNTGVGLCKSHAGNNHRRGRRHPLLWGGSVEAQIRK